MAPKLAANGTNNSDWRKSWLLIRSGAGRWAEHPKRFGLRGWSPEYCTASLEDMAIRSVCVALLQCWCCDDLSESLGQFCRVVRLESFVCLGCRIQEKSRVLDTFQGRQALFTFGFRGISGAEWATWRLHSAANWRIHVLLCRHEVVKRVNLVHTRGS